MIWGTVLSSFPIWAFFMAKYNFYEDSIETYERDESERIEQANLFKRIIEYRL